MIASQKALVLALCWVLNLGGSVVNSAIIEQQHVPSATCDGLEDAEEETAAASMKEQASSCGENGFSNASHTLHQTVSQNSDDINDHVSSPSIPRPDPSIVGYPVSRHSPDRRLADPVATVRPEHVEKNPLGVPDYEWKARTELAASYRLLYLAGLGSDQAAQCLMLRVQHPSNDTIGKTITFLMADWGVWFEEVTASNLLHFTVDGEQVDYNTNGDDNTPENRRDSYTTKAADPIRANSGCIPVAKAIFEARPDVSMIVHIHPKDVMAVGGMKHGLLPLSQAAFFLWGQVSREEYDFSYENSFEDNLAGGFSQGQRAMLLNHHGMYAVGRDAAEGLFVAAHLTQACQVQVKTLSMAGGDLNKVMLPSGDDLSRQYKDMMDSADYSYNGSREWPGIIRKVQREAPDYNA
ncbi:MAG: hypothetical protein SGILL_005339 [Bacillariaceae sp.]